MMVRKTTTSRSQSLCEVREHAFRRIHHGTCRERALCSDVRAAGSRHADGRLEQELATSKLPGLQFRAAPGLCAPRTGFRNHREIGLARRTSTIAFVVCRMRNPALFATRAVRSLEPAREEFGRDQAALSPV